MYNVKPGVVKNLISYFTLAYGLSWLIWLPLYGPALGIAGLPVLPYHHALGGLGPMLAAIFMTYRQKGSGGLQQLLKQCVRTRPLIYLLVALLSPSMLLLVAAVGEGLISHTVHNLDSFWQASDFPGMSLVVFFMYNLFFFGFGEEAGWRGFALPRLQQLLKPIPAALLLTVLWAIWHWPLFLYRPGYTDMAVSDIVGWVLSLLTGSVLLSWLYNGSRGSILICAIFHATVDIAFTSQLAKQGNIVNYMGFLITVWGIAMLWFLRSRRNNLQEQYRLLP